MLAELVNPHLHGVAQQLLGPGEDPLMASPHNQPAPTGLAGQTLCPWGPANGGGGQGNQGRVLTMVFSEFGRRVAQNGSGGTDHGTAAPMYFIGDMVKPGVHGIHPSMSKLDQGDLVHTIDFRTLYASVLEDWMGADSSEILKGRWKTVPLIKT